MNENNDSVKIVLLSVLLIVLIFTESLSLLTNKLGLESHYIIVCFFVFLSSLLLININDFLTLFIVLELQSLCLYALASLKKNSAVSTEAGLKYFIFGSVFTGIFLFAISILYGCLGSLQFQDLNILFSFNFEDDFFYLNHLVSASLFCIFAVFLFKLSIFPFHFWSPDVYEGSPLKSTLILILIPKLIFLSCLVKISFLVFENFSFLRFCVLIFGCLTVFWGSIFTFKQNRLKRFFIFSSLAQVGFAFSALASTYLEAYGFLFFFLLIYLISSVAVWGLYILIFSSSFNIKKFQQDILISMPLHALRNLFEQNFWQAFSVIITFFSLSGIPPLSGFLAKVFILFELLKNSFLVTSSVLILISSISVYYYIKFIKITFFEPSKDLNIYGSLILNTSVFGFEFFVISLCVCLLQILFLFQKQFC